MYTMNLVSSKIDKQDPYGIFLPIKFSKERVKTIEINTTQLIKAFKYLKKGGTFLYISSSEVYSGNPLPCTEDEIGVTNPSHPRACYIEGKRCGEAICHAYAKDGCNVKIARLALAYGPGTKENDTRVINQFIQKALTTGNITLLDEGEAQRTYCYVTDAVEMMWKIMLHGKSIVYNVGGFSTLSILELAEEIAMITNASVTLPDDIKRLPGAPDNVQLDMTKTLREFDRSFVPIIEGLRRTINYQRQLYAN